MFGPGEINRLVLYGASVADSRGSLYFRQRYRLDKSQAIEMEGYHQNACPLTRR